MKFLILDTTNPHFNLAVEEYLFRTSEEDVFMLWQNAPTVVIGKNQNAYAEADLEYLKKEGIYLARRITGGGAVYHDLGNVNYSFISRREEGTSFARLAEPIIEALASLGIRVSVSGRNDLLCEDGRKVSGCAEYAVGERVLHHGTLLFDADLTALSRALRPDNEKLATHAVKSTRSRVCNMRTLLTCDMGVSEFISRISDYIINRYAPKIIDVPLCDEVDKLTRRNASDGWLYPDSAFLSECSLDVGRRFAFGRVNVKGKIKNGIFESVRIFGDFFGNGDVSELEDKLVGKDVEEIRKMLSKTDIGSYIFGMTADDFISLIEP